MSDSDESLLNRPLSPAHNVSHSASSPILPDSTRLLERLADTIESRRGADPSRSYVAKLLAGGDDRILKKVGEEATETVIAAMQDDRAKLVAETADLWFHTLVMLVHHELRPEDVLAELARREGLSGIDEKASRPA